MRAARSVTSPPLGGCDFAADPDVSAQDQPIYWTEAASPTVLRFSAAPDDLVDRSQLGATLFDGAAVRLAEDGLHAVWRLGGRQLQGRFDAPAEGRAAAVILPLDDTLEVRALTAIRLARLLNHRPLSADPAPLSAARRAQLVQVVRALDARAEGASLRDIAEVLFGRRLPGRVWPDSDLRARTRRLVRSGLDLIRGGYRDLLNPRRERRTLTDEPRDEDTPS